MSRTDERNEFLTGILEEGVAYARYWIPGEIWKSNPDNTPVVEITDDDGETHTITLDTIARGLNMLSQKGTNYTNSGYDHSELGDTHTRIGLFNRTNGKESDADSMDFDAIIQLGVYGQVIYG